jgi:hypothetical protein
VRIEKAIKRYLMTPAERTTLTAKFNVSGLLRGDASARSALYHNGILDGWMTRNEARAAESELGIVLSPIDGLDLPLIPLNMEDGTRPPEPDEPESNPEPSSEANASPTEPQK